MTFPANIKSAQLEMAAGAIDAWLLYDFRDSNPILWDVLGFKTHTTRRVFIYVPASGTAKALVHHVDAGNFSRLGLDVIPYQGQDGLLQALAELLRGHSKVAMEYYPKAALPTLSWVDAGTVELVRSLGLEVVTSAAMIEAVLGQVSSDALEKHRSAARKLGEIVLDAFRFIGQKARSGLGELGVCDHIRQRFNDEGLWTDEGPIVAVNEHSGDPHYEPTQMSSRPMSRGDWVLIDLWAKEEDGVFADITWVGYLGERVPATHQKVFEIVTQARDKALEFIVRRHLEGKGAEGWEADRVAREHIVAAGYGEHFTHRLGHSLGQVVHGYGPNLDSLETKDNRKLREGLAFTIEPGIYLPGFGMRSEIDVYYGPGGPEVTSAIQREVVLIPWV